jgi:hypothetical protein
MLVICCPEQTATVLLVTVNVGRGFTLTDVLVDELLQPLAEAVAL